MDKDKLIALIAKKQTYKDTKIVQNDIAKKKQYFFSDIRPAVNVSISAIQQILKQSYNAQAKLFAMRFLKDCFEKGNPLFISKTETEILPLMEKIIRDFKDENKIAAYVGQTFSKNENLQKFKSIFSSLFVMCRECIENWGQWIPDPKRNFSKYRKTMNKDFPQNFRDKYQYFRQENYLIFKENCQKNGVVFASQNQMEAPSEKTTPGQSKLKKQMQPQQKIQAILFEIGRKVEQPTLLSSKEFDNYENNFNTAINEFLEKVQNFDERYLENSFQKFQNYKKMQKQKHLKNKNKKESTIKEKQRISQSKKQQPKKEQVKKQVVKKEQPKKEQVKKQVVKKQQPKKQQTKVNAKKQEQILKSEKVENKSNKRQKLQNETIKRQTKVSRVQDVDDYQKFLQFIPQSNQFVQDQKMIKESRQSNKKKSSLNIPQPRNSKKKNLDTSQEQSRVRFDESSEDDDEESKIEPKINVKKPPSQIRDRNEKFQASQSSAFKKEKSSQDFVKLKTQVEETKRQKKGLEEKVKILEKEIKILKDSQGKMMNQIKKGISVQEYETLKKELINEKKEKRQMGQQIQILKNQLKNLEKKFASQLSELSEKQKNLNFGDISKVKEKIQLQKEESSMKDHSYSRHQLQSSPTADLVKQRYSPRIDEDYVNNATHFSNIHSWLSGVNIINLKKSILGISQIFYEDEIMSISKSENIFSKDGFDFISLTLSYQFKHRQNRLPKIVYKNIQEVDLWTKPLNKRETAYIHQLVGRLCGNPLKLIKTSVVESSNTTINLFLPILFYSYLKPAEFQSQQFQDIYEAKKESILKSKVFKINNYIASTIKDIKGLFKEAVIREGYVEFCLSEESKENAFMIQFEALKNQKGLVRVLPIPVNSEMKTKAKEIIDNLVFLLSE